MNSTFFCIGFLSGVNMERMFNGDFIGAFVFTILFGFITIIIAYIEGEFEND